MSQDTWQRVIFGTVVAGVVCAPVVRADLPRDEYLKQLQIASQAVQRHQEAGRAGATQTSRVKTVLGRFYQKGDQWDVIAWSIDPTDVRQTPNSAQLAHATARGAYLHYEVTDTKYGTTPEVTLKVTQQTGFGLTPVDSRVDAVTLVFNDRVTQTAKSYAMNDRTHAQPASPEGARLPISLLELFPLDVPSLQDAVSSTPSSVPALPEGLDTLAQQAGWAPDPSQSTLYEQDDFFGRQVLALWKHGDLWPSYMKTGNGVAILVAQHPAAAAAAQGGAR